MNKMNKNTKLDKNRKPISISNEKFKKCINMLNFRKNKIKYGDLKTKDLFVWILWYNLFEYIIKRNKKY